MYTISPGPAPQTQTQVEASYSLFATQIPNSRLKLCVLHLNSCFSY